MFMSWENELASEKTKSYYIELMDFLASEIKLGKVIYPPAAERFQAFALTPLDQVKVIILGQDPYHGSKQAHGLAFSVRPGVKIPPSLQNIFKELKTDLGIDAPPHGNLESWAKRGVLLLNTVLTVEEGQAGSHHQKGWEQFTDKVIEILNEKKENLVFILWGAPAQKKARMVDSQRHFILTSPHPSPLASYRGFFGSKPFSKTNEFLHSCQLPPIDWTLDLTHSPVFTSA